LRCHSISVFLKIRKRSIEKSRKKEAEKENLLPGKARRKHKIPNGTITKKGL
jgi:hypothetical protein